MRGFPYKSYFPNGQDLKKQASIGHSNRWIDVDTAVHGDMTPLLLVSGATLAGIAPEALTLYFDNRPYTWLSFDPLSQQHKFTAVAATVDVHEGQERMENEGGVVGKIGPATRGVSSIHKTAENWPIGGDRPDVGGNVEVLEHSHGLAYPN